MILRVRERIRGRTGGCWGWDSVLKKKIYAEFTENADSPERKEKKEPDGGGKPHPYKGREEAQKRPASEGGPYNGGSFGRAKMD